MKDSIVDKGETSFLEIVFALLISVVVLSGFGSIVYSFTGEPDSASMDYTPQIAIVEVTSNLDH